MLGRATTTISILSDSTDTDDYGDPIDNDTVEASGIRMMLIEQNTKPSTEVTGRPRVVRRVTGRVCKGTSVNANNRILDEKTGLKYTIINVSDVQNPVRGQDIRIDMVHVDEIP